MTWGIRRIVFTIGAMLLMGGWGLTGYVDAYQHAAGAAAGVRWREGEQATTATLRSAPVSTDVSDGAIAGPDPMAEIPIARPRRSPREMQLTRQILPPSSWLYALGVMVMMAGAGLMALMVPWRGARMAAAAEAGEHYIPPPPRRGSKAPRAMKAPARTASAPSFAGVPPLQEAQSVAAAPIMAPAHDPPGTTATTGMKPLLYKKGA